MSQRREGAHRPRSSVRGRVITATEAARSFSALLDRVEHRAETYVVERGGNAVCEIRPIGPAMFRLSDLVALLSNGAKPDPQYWDAIENLTKAQMPASPSPWEP